MHNNFNILPRENTIAARPQACDCAAMRPLLQKLMWLRHARHETFDTHHTLYREGDAGQWAFYIHEGIVKLLTHMKNGRTRIVRLHTGGDLVGIDGLFSEVYRQSAIAVTPVTVTQVANHSIKDLERQAPHEYCHFLNEVYRHLQLSDTWIKEFSTGDVKSRVYRFVHFLSTIEYGANANKVTLLKTQEIADTLGVTPESASRVIAELKREGILRKQQDWDMESYRIDKRKLR